MNKICCNEFRKYSTQIQWFSFKDDNQEKVMVIPNINNKRINNCPFCGSNIRSIAVKEKEFQKQ